MRIHRAVNNNMVIVLDGNGRERILMGKGIGYRRHSGDGFDETLVDREFRLAPSEQTERLAELVGEIAPEVIDTVSGIFQSILGIMAACGMVKGLKALFVALSLYPEGCGAYLVFNAVGDGLFHFLPLFLGYTAAKKFGLKPMLTLLVSISLGFLIIGPLAIFGANLIAGFVMAVRNVSPMIAGAIVGLTSDSGAELLIHIGMDTVRLEGKYFTALVKEGDRVAAGQKLVEFDMEAIQAAGYSLVTPVVVTNSEDYLDVVGSAEGAFLTVLR